MKSTVLRYEDDLIYTKLKEYAAKQHLSLNKAINNIMGIYLGIRQKKKLIIHHDMDEFFGLWTEEEYQQMQESLKETRQIDHEMWK